MSGIDSKTIAIVALILAVVGLGYGYLSPGPVGPQGPAGPQGATGATGPQGPAGESVDESQLQASINASVDEALNERLQINIEGYVTPNRGCPSCHVLADNVTGRYTLSYEAHERVEARRGVDIHPVVAPDGTDISPTSTAGVETCLLCHAPDPATGRGVQAPLSLRDIVHPAHMYSQYFKLHYGGNCFSCHNVNAEGDFEILSQAVTTNEKGVPDPDLIPIPGAIEAP